MNFCCAERKIKMSPPVLSEECELDPDGKYFSKLTTILYISCCYTNTDDIRNEFNTRDIGHTSSVVRKAAHEMVDYFHSSGDGIAYIKNEIVKMIMKIPRVASTEYVSRDVAEYITPYIFNQLLNQYENNIRNFNLQETDLE